MNKLKVLLTTQQLQRFSPQNYSWLLNYMYIKYPTQINWEYKGFQQFAPKNFFEFVHIFGVLWRHK